ncbi:MAG: DUF4347 domain-containing protein, partial [Methylovulum sp.]|nr:DUF4347 domain-containing protein [Methylovulum sp.]
MNEYPLNQLIIIDSRVTGWQSLIRTFSPDAKLLILDSSRDGLAQIYARIAALQAAPDVTPLQTIHIISHGSAGNLQLGATTLDTENLAEHARQLAAIGRTLSHNGDILLYACDVAGNGTGLQFIKQLGALTHAEVAASDNLTGSALQGGDWLLEQATGTIESTPLSGAAFDVYSGVLEFITGTTGDDYLPGTNNDDILDGKAGADQLYGYDGNDQLTGGTGNDYLIGNAGADTYPIAKGDGHDEINNWDADNSVDTVQFINVASTDISAKYRDPGSANYNNGPLVLQYGTGGQLTVDDYFYSPEYRIDQFKFSDGVIWGWDDLKALGLIGSAFDDSIHGYAGGSNTLKGLAGNDYLKGVELGDVLDGGADADRLYGDDGADKLIGGTGNDYLEGNAGADTYVITKADGQDEIYNWDADNSTDTVQFI